MLFVKVSKNTERNIFNSMKRRTVKILRSGVELLCLVLVFSMLICAVPAIAEEVSDDTAENSTPTTVDVIKLLTNVSRGTRLKDADFEIVTVKNFNVPSNIISDPDEVDGMYAKEDLYAGEYVSTDQISDDKVSKVNSDVLLKDPAKCTDDYVVVTDYVKPNTGEALEVFLQEIIDNNPKRTIYFPDGEYVIASPLFTDAGRDSVSILLSDGAVIKASKNFKNRTGSALIHLGGGGAANNISQVGSYYVVSGGTLDGNSVADGISVDSGRESVIRNICIKNPKSMGIYVAKGANNGSSDLDFEDITIIGNGMLGTTGMMVDGYDNTFTNIRVYNMAIGMNITTGGNLLKSIYVSIDDDASLLTSATEGIKIKSNNWVSACHVVNAQKAYSFGSGGEIWDCSAEWTTTKVTRQIMFVFSGNNLTMSGCRADFCTGNGVSTAIVNAGGNATSKFIEGCAFNVNDVTDKSYEKFLVNANSIIPRS